MIVVATTAENGDETRVALSPETAKKLKSLGCEVRIQAGAGGRSYFLDQAFAEAGAKVLPSAAEALDGADIVLKVRRPSAEDIGAIKRGAVLAAMLDPYSGREGIDALAGAGINAFSMEFMPRITRAQVDGRAVLAGEPRRLQGGGRCGRAFRARFADDDDRRRHRSRRARLRHGRGRRRPAGHRDRPAARRRRHRHRRAPGREGAGR